MSPTDPINTAKEDSKKGQDKAKKAKPDKIYKYNQEQRLLSALAYIGPLCLVTVIVKQDDDYCMFHGKQGFLLFLLMIIVYSLAFIPFIGGVLRIIGGIPIVGLMIVGIMNAMQEKREKLPIIGKYFDF